MENGSNWFVITGGPSSGKSTVLGLLAELGYKVIPEAARVLIEEEMAKGKKIEEIRGNEQDFQRRVLKEKIRTENNLLHDFPRQTIFFDRAIPDSIPYFRICGLDPSEVLPVCQRGLYKKVFMMEQLPFEQDGRRTEDHEEVKVLNRLLPKAYKDLDYKIVFVPRMSPIRDISIAKRLLLILNHLHS